MPKNSDLTPIQELRDEWEELWGIKPHKYIGRIMLQKSIEFKRLESAGHGLSPEQKLKLDKLVKQYKRDKSCFDNKVHSLKPGTRLDRTYKGHKHTVIVKEYGFEYNSQLYPSLSRIANDITGKKWNGWIFFGLKKAGGSS